ncbi:hypothetical protein GCM10023083_18120 [Streptomyces phyllanthi]|uniref:outer membrane protein assembly factor BamB family protein n=1 Tax=Streptomyces phyllanthi TaxID=1803180 RepID=UPI002AD54F9A|nr:PQQ-binding-like beta-propeller repeat protein [Streptomyces phyllanthi]
MPTLCACSEGSDDNGGKVAVPPFGKTRARPVTPEVPEARLGASRAPADAVEFPATAVPPRLPPRRVPRLLPAALALVLAALVLAAAHAARPAPYGDRLTLHARVPHASRAVEPRLRWGAAAVEAYDRDSGRPYWTYSRAGRRPLAVLPARGHAIALWDDGLVTDTDPHHGRARWHRALPGAADWLAAHGGAGVLRLLDARTLAVVTPHRVAAYRLADGDLRWALPARRGCAFAPSRAVRHGTAVLIAQPCGPDAAWPANLVAVDGRGRIARDR